MNQWAFVLAAYGAVGLATLALVTWAFLAMRVAEGRADAAKRGR